MALSGLSLPHIIFYLLYNSVGFRFLIGMQILCNRQALDYCPVDIDCIYL